MVTHFSILKKAVSNSLSKVWQQIEWRR
jgi:hypothetical protein